MVIAILFYFLLSFENSLSRAVASMHESRSAGAAVASKYSLGTLVAGSPQLGRHQAPAAA